MNVIYAVKEWRKRYTGVYINCLCPGPVNTAIISYTPWWCRIILRPLLWIFFQTPKQGAQNTLHVATTSEKELEKGPFFKKCHLKDLHSIALNEELQKHCWDIAMQLIEGYLPKNFMQS